MTWRLAKSLETLRAQINALAPSRSKLSDGTKGDDAHASRTSDHNPNGDGVVTALDITHDPAHGVDSEKLAEMLRASRDPRIKYIISNKKIASFDKGWTWRSYTGSNPHNKHVHISVKGDRASYDGTAPWSLSLSPVVAAAQPPAPSEPLLKLGAKGKDVERLQALINKRGEALKVDGDFGAATKAALQRVQAKLGLVADGVAGAYTWEKLKGV